MVDTITIELDPQGKPVTTPKPVKTKTVSTTPGSKTKKSKKTDDDVAGAVIFICLAFLVIVFLVLYLTRRTWQK